ncbi:hypothetical protein F2Q70_00005685 [Brassica cretica]|uniref:Zinc knuckle CX2CX4HX4C domain-containing protein n=1 Tax=Brassica cretica TaxID=69181 RepID=A0A8S9ITU2_BRACR|nr:hypothetical protein F2Q70_00005685 [Brassica cretica]
MRVSLNGLNPIIKDTIVDFDTGEEAPVSLEYEGIQHMCSNCNPLTHYTKDCPSIATRTLSPDGKQTYTQANSYADSRQ